MTDFRQNFIEIKKDKDLKMGHQKNKCAHFCILLNRFNRSETIKVFYNYFTSCQFQKKPYNVNCMKTTLKKKASIKGPP